MDDTGAAAPSGQNARLHGGHELISGPIGRTLIVFSMPTLVSNILQSLSGSINSIWVGRFLGEGALAATANANLLMFVTFALVFGIGMAVTVFVGQSIGRNDISGARRFLGTALGFSFLFSCIVGVAGWVWSPALLHALLTPEAIFPMGLIYLRILFLNMPAIAITSIVMAGLRGAGDAVTPLNFMILSLVLGLVLNPLFILGLGPIPPLGIAGSALASVVASYIGLAALIVYAFAKDVPLCFRGKEWGYLIPDLAQTRLLLVKGLPIGLQMLLGTLAMLVSVGLANKEGVLTAAAYAAVQQLWGYIQMPSMAIGGAVTAMAAQNIGAGRWDRVGAITRAGLLCNLAVTGLLVGLTLLFDRQAFALFLGATSQATEIGCHIQLQAFWSFFPFALGMLLSSTMRANGVVIAPMLINLIAMFPLRLGFYFLAYPVMGADALWHSFNVGYLASFLLTGAYYWKADWRSQRS